MKQVGRILLIDDDKISSWLNITMLERSGLVSSIEALEEGKTALDYLKGCCADSQEAGQLCPDLILLDLDMPDLNGFQVLDALQESTNCRWLISDRVIILTGSMSPADREKAYAYPVYDFLAKPLTLTKLNGVLEQFLNRDAAVGLTNQTHTTSTLPATDREPLPRTSADNSSSETKENQDKGPNHA